jgi:hypothetical protein
MLEASSIIKSELSPVEISSYYSLFCSVTLARWDLLLRCFFSISFSLTLIFQLYGHHEAKLDPLGILAADLSGERPEGIKLSSHKLSKTTE